MRLKNLTKYDIIGRTESFTKEFGMKMSVIASTNIVSMLVLGGELNKEMLDFMSGQIADGLVLVGNPVLSESGNLLYTFVRNVPVSTAKSTES